MNNFSNSAGHVTFMKTKDNTVTSTQNVTMSINKTMIKKKQGNEPSIIKVAPSNYDEEQIRNLLSNA